MSELPYKLNIKIGVSEFSGEGREESVRADYQSFLERVDKAGGTQPTAPLAAHLVASGAVTGALGGAAGDELMARVYKKNTGGIVSLRHLPVTATKVADSAILLIYGFMKLGGMDEVPVTKLNEGMRDSGLNVDRLDRYIGVHRDLYRKGGQKSGGRYTLNNQGTKKAEEWLQAWD